MGRQKIFIAKETLERFYVKKNFSAYRLGKKLGCSYSTIINRLQEYGMPKKDKAHMRVVYAKRPFDGNEKERAYLIGFRLGDLNVYKPSPNSKIFVVRCHTTIRAQANLIRSLFKKYGGVKIFYSPTNGFTVNCFLDDSFDFLYLKKLPLRVFQDHNTAYSFMAGYTDAEGSFGLNQGKGRFKIDSYDFEILRKMSDFLRLNGVATKFRLIARRGTESGMGYRWNCNLWRLDVNEALSLERFIKTILRYLKHSKRIKDAKIVLANIYARRKRGSIR